MCGEKQFFVHYDILSLGSPPHVRGKGPTGQRPFLDTWITPACAGKRQAFTNQNLLKGDHPRMCGEKKPSLLLLFMIVGSPPHVRGKECPCVRRVPLPRITPACAGKRSYECGTVQCGRDHPRVCGEKQYQYKRILSQLRITPACAGKSLPRPGNAGAGWDHPRVCGEKSGDPPPQQRARGSPPRVRGKATGIRDKRIQDRITPACAGKSRPSGKIAQLHKDHPRVCGEKHEITPFLTIPKGSPPRVRGKVHGMP